MNLLKTIAASKYYERVTLICYETGGYLLTRLRCAGLPSLRLRRKEGREDFYKKELSSVMQNIIQFCRDLRRQETTAEKLLWVHLRNRNMSGYKFLRQHPLCVEVVLERSLYYIPDFYCDKAKLVIEADGPIHLLKKEYDKNRDEVLKGLGLTILRFDNEQILNDMASVLNTINHHLK